MKNIPDFKLKYSKDGIPILKALEIDSHASMFLQEFSKLNSDYSFLTPQQTPIDRIIELYCEIPIDFQIFADEDVLGMTSFSSGFIKIIRDEIEVLYKVDKGSIIISAELDVEEKQLGRLNYTMAHELGHNIALVTYILKEQNIV